MNASRQPPPGQNSATLLALLALIGAGFGLLALAALVIPQVIGLLVVVAGFGLFCLFHYLVWGWWMSPRRRDEANDSGDSKDEQ